MILVVSIAVALAFNQFRGEEMPLIGDWSVESRLASSGGGSLVISLEEARALFESGNVLFLDARPEVWYEMGHIKGARNIPTEKFEMLYPESLQGIPTETPLITYCDGEGCELSHDLAFALLEKGYTNVRVLINGWTLWSQAALPVEGSDS